MTVLRGACLAGLVSGVLVGPLWAQETAPPADPEAIDPAVLQEGPVAQLGLGVGYGTETGAAVSAFARADRLLGEGHRLGFRLQLGEDSGSVDVDYGYAPLFGRDDLAFGLNLTGIAARATDAFAFETRSISVSPRLVYSLSGSVTLSPYLSVSAGRVEGVAAGSSALITRDAGQRDTASVGLDATWRQRDEAGGTASSVQGGIALGRSDRDHSFAALTLDARHDRLLGAEGNVQLSFGLSAGTILTGSGASHIGDRTVLGPSLLRGFELGGVGPRDLNAPGSPALGGNSHAVLRLEARAPNLFGGDGLRPVPGLFVDAGSLWGLDATGGGPSGADPVDDAFHLRGSTGLMLDLETEFGTFQISVSHPVRFLDDDRRAPFNLGYSMAF